MEAWHVVPHSSKEGEREERAESARRSHWAGQRPEVPSGGATPCRCWSTGKAEQSQEGSEQQSKDASPSDQVFDYRSLAAFGYIPHGAHPGTVLLDGSQPMASPLQAAITPAMTIERRWCPR